MIQKSFDTPCGTICYWCNDFLSSRQAMVFLPGLTADHRLFDPQVKEFQSDFNILVWDAPGHAASRPFSLDFSLMDKAGWLHEILQLEGIVRPILVGQSMGGYVSQCFLERYPGEAAGFVSIDSAPLKRTYVTAAEIWLLKRTEPMYRAFPWNSLKRLGTNGSAASEYGRHLMRTFVDSYTKNEYCALSGHGMKLLADAMEADLPYRIDCPAILICGEKDQAGSAKHYNRRWAKKEGLPLYWIRDAGHNANTDQPDTVNQILRTFALSLKEVSK